MEKSDQDFTATAWGILSRRRSQGQVASIAGTRPETRWVPVSWYRSDTSSVVQTRTA